LGHGLVLPGITEQELVDLFVDSLRSWHELTPLERAMWQVLHWLAGGRVQPEIARGLFKVS
jgi:hypothetical protein